MNIYIKNVILFLFVFFTQVKPVFSDEPFQLIESKKTIDHTQIAIYTTPHREKTSKGVFVYSHGMTSRVLYHQKLLNSVYDAGFDIITYDLPGHGHSERFLGIPGGIRGLDQLLNVLEGVTQEGINIYKNEKIFFSGWSLGGLITTLYLQHNPLRGQAAVLYAPGVALGMTHGDFSSLGGVNTENLVQDEIFAQTLRNDPSFFRFPPLCLVTALVAGVWQVDPTLYRTPTLLITAGKDQFVSEPNVIEFYTQSANLNGKKLISYRFPDSKHDLENDSNSAAVLKSTTDYLNSSLWRTE